MYKIKAERRGQRERKREQWHWKRSTSPVPCLRLTALGHLQTGLPDFCDHIIVPWPQNYRFSTKNIVHIYQIQVTTILPGKFSVVGLLHVYKEALHKWIFTQYMQLCTASTISFFFNYLLLNSIFYMKHTLIHTYLHTYIYTNTLKSKWSVWY